jgi:hypothetical protein
MFLFLSGLSVVQDVCSLYSFQNLFYSLWDYFRQNIYMSVVFVILPTCTYRWTERDLFCPRIKLRGIVKIWMSFHHETTGFVIKYSESKPVVRNSRHVQKKILLFNDVSCFVTTIIIHRFSFPCFVSISTIFTSALESTLRLDFKIPFKIGIERDSNCI